MQSSLRSALASAAFRDCLHLQVQLREGDLSWSDFEARASKTDGFTSHAADVNEITNILFSSGTTGEIFV